MGWVGAKRRHFALIGIRGGVVLLLGRDGDDELTSAAEAETAMTRRGLERVTGDMFVYLKHEGRGGGDEADDPEDEADDDGDEDEDEGDASPCAAAVPAPPMITHATLEAQRPRGSRSGSRFGSLRRRSAGRKLVLETPGREYQLRAETSSMARAWVAAFKDSIASAAINEDGGGVEVGSGVVESTPSPSRGRSRSSGGSPDPWVEGGGTSRAADAARSPSPDGGLGGGLGSVGVSRADLVLESPVPTWELDSPTSSPGRPPSPGSSWARATYRADRPTYINARFFSPQSYRMTERES
jgi:hypothetical protein